MVSSPGVCVENGVANVVVSVAVELLRSTLGSDTDLSARGPAVFRRVVGGEDLDFLGRVHVGRAQTGAVGASAHRGSAVKGNQALRRAGAIDVAGTLAEAERQAGQVAATSSGHQVGHEDRIPPVELQ